VLHLLWLVPAVPFVGFLVLVVAGPRLRRTGVAIVGAGSIAISTAIALAVAAALVATPPAERAFTQTLWTWVRINDFAPAIAFRLDPLSLIMMLVVAGVSFLIHLYSTEFMEDEEGYARFFAYMNLFVGSMLVLVLADNLLLLYFGWEGVGLCSYLLIGFWYRDAANANAGRKAFIVTRVGDTAMAIGLFVIATRLGTEYPTTNEGWVSRLETLRQAFLPREVPLVLGLMMAGVTLVLFIACSNVANLLLARAAGRRREISVRAALGAGRGRIVRQLLTESLVLGLLSVPLGILLAVVGTRLIAAGIPPDQVPYYIHWEVDWRAVTYTIIVAAGTAVVFGLFPALQVSRGNLHETLKEGTRGNTVTKSFLRSTLVVAQIAFALVALVGALLFVRTFLNLGAFNVGFDVRPLMSMRFYMPGETYEQPDAKLRRVEDIVRRVEALPAVRATYASNFVPLAGGGGGGTVIIDGRPAEKGKEVGISVIGVTPHFNPTMGLAILEGRDFTDAEGWS